MKTSALMLPLLLLVATSALAQTTPEDVICEKAADLVKAYNAEHHTQLYVMCGDNSRAIRDRTIRHDISESEKARLQEARKLSSYASAEWDRVENQIINAHGWRSAWQDLKQPGVLSFCDKSYMIVADDDYITEFVPYGGECDGKP